MHGCWNSLAQMQRWVHWTSNKIKLKVYHFVHFVTILKHKINTLKMQLPVWKLNLHNAHVHISTAWDGGYEECNCAKCERMLLLGILSIANWDSYAYMYVEFRDTWHFRQKKKIKVWQLDAFCHRPSCTVTLNSN